MSDVSRILDLVERGETEAGEQLLPAAYSELRRIAAHMMANERDGHTLQATALVHEAYLRLAGADGSAKQWNSPGHFFSAAAEAMRRVLIESARRRMAKKRGAGAEHTAWDDSKIASTSQPDQMLCINAALDKLEQEDSSLANIVKLRYFVGLSVAETAALLESSPRSVNRKWECARAWLFREVSDTQ